MITPSLMEGGAMSEAGPPGWEVDSTSMRRSDRSYGGVGRWVEPFMLSISLIPLPKE